MRTIFLNGVLIAMMLSIDALAGTYSAPWLDGPTGDLEVNLHPAKVVGVDERRALNAAELKIASGIGYFRVGNIPNDNEFVGTGFSVFDRRFVLTASHIFADKPTGKGWNDLILHEGRPVVEDIYFYSDVCQRSYPVAEVERAEQDFRNFPDLDLALVRLARPLCKKADPLSVMAFDKDFVESQIMPQKNPLMLIGYNWIGYNLVRRVSYGGWISHFYNRYNMIFKHTADMEHGWSGGPMIFRHNGSPVVVGINSGSIDDPKEPNTALTISKAALEWIRQSIRDGKVQAYPPR